MRVIGRYVLHDEIAAGGMATVHLGRLLGPVGFSRTVAIKRLHPQFAKDPEFVSMFLDEARLASRIQHPNVISTLDVVALSSELFLVMEYVEGETLSRLIKAGQSEGKLPDPGCVVSILAGTLHGLHCAHEAKTRTGAPLEIVHRDVSPQNILVGTDGVARVLDFGVAKATMRAQTTRDGKMKGKLSYMAPEQLLGKELDRRVDVFAAGIVLWEALCGRRLFTGSDPGGVIGKALNAPIPLPSSLREDLPKELDDIVMQALDRDRDKRYQTALAFAEDLEGLSCFELPRKVGRWVTTVCQDALARRSEQLAAVENASAVMPSPSNMPPSSPEATAEDYNFHQAEPSDTPTRQTNPVRASVTGERHTPTDISSVSTKNATPESRRRQKRWPLLAAAGAGAAAVLGVVFALGGRDVATKDGSSSVSAPLPAAAAAPVASAPLEATPAASVVPAASVETKPLESAAPEKSATPSRVTPTATSTATKPSTKKSTATAQPKKANCNPPFTIDSSGIRRVKPGCL